MIGRKHKFSKRKKLTEIDCKEIFEETVAEGEKAGMDLAERKGYSVETFYKCIRNNGVIDPKWKHPEHSKKWSDDLIEKSIELISQNPILTLSEIISMMIEKYNAPEITETTLGTYLRFSLITLKQVQYHATARNSHETKQQRIEYGEFFLQNKDLNFVFIDEVGYSISVQRNRGRAPKGKNVIAKTPLSKTPNTSVCMAITNEEIIHYQKKNSAFNSESFSNFLKDLIEIIENSQMTNVCLVLDNSSVHKKEIVKELCNGRCKYKFLPPYSPNLNPIENIFAIIKKYMKKELATELREQLLETFHLPWGQKTAARQSILDQAFVTALTLISTPTLQNTYQHMLKYVSLALEGKDI